MKSPREHAEGLLEKASHDLVAARATMATGQALDTVCFHAQQAAEKSLKALLALKDVVYPWHHDLGELLQMVLGHFPQVGSMENDLLLLSPYAVEVRYDEAIRPDIREAQAAVEIASRMYALAEQLVMGTDSHERIIQGTCYRFFLTERCAPQFCRARDVRSSFRSLSPSRLACGHASTGILTPFGISIRV